MPNILITGAASGLGQAFLRHYVQQLYTSHGYVETKIYAIDRSSSEPEFLAGTCSDAEHERWAKDAVESIKLDVTSHDEITRLFEARLAGVPLDLVIHAAGIRGLINDGESIGKYEDVRGAENMGAMDAETMRKAFDVNVLGSFEVFRACVPGLKRAAAHGTVPKVIVMGSRMGSIGNNQQGNANAGGAFAYRASKAGLNAVVRSFAVDVPEVIWTVVHPGRVETGLVRIKEDGAMTVEESVGDMMRLIEGLQSKDNGRFVDRFGVDMPW